MLEGFRREVTVSDLCRREGIKPHSYYAWTKEFMEAGRERLTRRYSTPPPVPEDERRGEGRGPRNGSLVSHTQAQGSQRAWSRPEHLLPVAEAEGAARTGE